MGEKKQTSTEKEGRDEPVAEASSSVEVNVGEAGVEVKTEASAKPDVEELMAQLEEARDKAAQSWDGMLRAKAELENLRKRVSRDVENAHKYGLERIVTELLPVRDSMELGLAATSEEGVEIGAVREGMELTLKMLSTAMEKFNIKEVNPEGEKFDPELHQAMSMQEADGVASGTVTKVFQKGYLLNDRLVRPAMVIVAK